MVFWIVAGVISLTIAGLLSLVLLRGRTGEEHPAEYDLRVYRDQLKEIDRDLARGVIADADAERVRTEVSRRILAADAQLRDGQETGGQPRSSGFVMIALMGVVLIGGALGLYWQLGAPGYSDLPLETRIESARQKHDTRASQSEFEAQLPALPPLEVDPEYNELVVKLREKVATRPDDLAGHQLLARTEANLGNDKAAYEAQEIVVRLKGDEATAQDLVFLAELKISAARGYVSPEAEAALKQALQIQPRNPVGRYYWGLMLIQNDRPDLAFKVWEDLIYESPPDAPWLVPIRSQIEDLAWLAGVDFRMPEALTPSGPSAEDMQAAAEMSEEDRQEMIQGMVAGLAERLATEGGTPEDWARLIGAYGVLGDIERAEAIWSEAQQVFAANPDALNVVRNGARQAGIAE